MRSLLFVLLVAAAAMATAQEGFPLDGTWRGQRENTGQNTGRNAGQDAGQSAKEAPVTIVIVMQWDGQKVTGVINPGPKAIPLLGARLVPEGWRVSVSARTAAGEPIAFEGAITDLGAYNRVIEGTWTEGGRSYPIRMVRE
jgi:hypothetical protein